MVEQSTEDYFDEKISIANKTPDLRCSRKSLLNNTEDQSNGSHLSVINMKGDEIVNMTQDINELVKELK